jgi:hypothetical protein
VIASDALAGVTHPAGSSGQFDTAIDSHSLTRYVYRLTLPRDRLTLLPIATLVPDTCTG